MRKEVTWLMATLAALPACGSSGGGPATTATTVTIKTGPSHVDLLAFRDDADASWHSATQVGADEYTLAVTGPYWITVVCHDEFVTPANHGTNVISTLKLGRTLDDPHVVDQPLCPGDVITPLFSVRIDFGNGLDSEKYSFGNSTIGIPSAVAGRVQAGTYDVYAAAAGHLLITRDIAVNSDVELAVDVAGQGAPLVAAPFTVTNAASGSNVQLSASVQIERGHRDLANAFQFSEGDPASLVAATPELALTSDEFQTAAATEKTSLSSGISRIETRSYRRPYWPGDPTELTLPAPLPHTNWEIQDGPPSASWFDLPEDMTFRFVVIGYGNDVTYVRHEHVLQVSPAFRKATGVTRVQAETDMPGYEPTWAPYPAAIYMLNTYGETDADPATTPVSSVSDEWQLGIVG